MPMPASFLVLALGTAASSRQVEGFISEPLLGDTSHGCSLDMRLEKMTTGLANYQWDLTHIVLLTKAEGNQQWGTGV